MNNLLKTELLKLDSVTPESIKEDGMDLVLTYRFKEYGELAAFLERSKRKAISFGKFLNKQEYTSDGEGNWTGLDFPFSTEEAFDYFESSTALQSEEDKQAEKIIH
jgi:hypothetical protein